MKITYEVKIGDKSYFIEDEYTSMRQAFEAVSAWQALEIEAHGMKDVFLSHRKTSGGDDYYALIRPFEGLELSCGIIKEGNGKLFPGKYNKTEKRTDKEWKRLQHATYTDASNEELTSTELSNAAPSTNREPVIAISAKEQSAKFVALGEVKAFGCASQRTYRVGPEGASHEVWRDEAGSRQCDCVELKELRRRNSKAECAHIMAVALFVSAQPAKQPGNREQPGQARTRGQ